MKELSVSIAVATFGSDRWRLLAAQRAIPSARSFGVPVMYNHGNSLHEARNACLNQTETEFITYLDADDELAPGYFEHMSQVDGDLRPPSVNHVYERVTFMPSVVGKTVHTHQCKAECLKEGNFLVIGTVARTELLKEVGGWKEWGNYEDYDMWMRCWLAGATITPVPKAVYRAYSTAQGRCKSMSVRESRLVQYQIGMTNMPSEDWEWLKT